MLRGRLMKYLLLIPLLAAFHAGNSFSDDRIYRCGNEYTNTLPANNARDCKLLQGSNVTVVKGTRPATTSAPAPVVASAGPRVVASAGPRVDPAEQRLRDSDARQILELELKKAQTREFELQKEYNNGEPEKRGDEARNPQKYFERVAELKASLQRNESDIAGIRRELGRASPVAAAK